MGGPPGHHSGGGGVTFNAALPWVEAAEGEVRGALDVINDIRSIADTNRRQVRLLSFEIEEHAHQLAIDAREIRRRIGHNGGEGAA